jgi:transposase
VYELLNWRDAQRQLKGLIKARYRQWGVLKLHGLKVFSKKWRQAYLPQLPGEEERRMILRLYAQHDHAAAQWKETLKEVERVGKAFWEVQQFERLPGVGPIAAHVFSAIIEEPGRFKTKHQLWKYSGLGITDRTSDNKPLGYQRLDRRGNRELKNLSYHAWRTACKSTTGAKCDQELLPPEPAAHRQCAPRALEHPAQDFGNHVANVAAAEAL